MRLEGAIMFTNDAPAKLQVALISGAGGKVPVARADFASWELSVRLPM